MLTKFRRILCRHRNLVFVRNIYGDEINWCGGYRSVWQCCDCGRFVWSDKLYKQYSNSKCNVPVCDIMQNTLKKQYGLLDYGKHMSIDDAISHINELIENGSLSGSCMCEHKQLRDWLLELKERRERDV